MINDIGSLLRISNFTIHLAISSRIAEVVLTLHAWHVGFDVVTYHGWVLSGRPAWLLHLSRIGILISK